MTNYDRDNEQLTYSVIKNGNTASPIFTTTAPSSCLEAAHAGLPGHRGDHGVRATPTGFE